MSQFVNSVKSTALGVAEFFTPILKESRFRETGVLTPEEFVAAGDHLVYTCPTWRWEAIADAAKAKSYLPSDKQFLTSKSVPCYRRCRQMEYDPVQEKVLDGDDEGDGEGWVDTHHFATDVGGGVREMDTRAAVAAAAPADDDDDDDDDAPAMDMEDFAESGLLDSVDPNVLDTRAAAAAAAAADEEGGVVETRTYDLNITYDRYYQVPRMWLVGFDEKRSPLSVDQMYEDFSQDHVKKTITMETHPHLPGPPIASIHPCRHAEVMKRLIEQLADNGKELGVHQYLLIFLKFVQAVIPTVEYDYTRSIQL